MAGQDLAGGGAKGGGEAVSREGFLLGLADSLRPVGDPVQVQAVACRLLGERLGADRTFYACVDDGGVATIDGDYSSGGVVSLVGRHRLAEFGRAGRRQHDADARRLGTGSLHIAPAGGVARREHSRRERRAGQGRDICGRAAYGEFGRGRRGAEPCGGAGES